MMQLRYFLLGMLTLLTLTSCKVKDSDPTAEESPQKQSQTFPAKSEQPPTASNDGSYDDSDDVEEAYDDGDQADESVTGRSQLAAQGQSADPNQVSRMVQTWMQIAQQRSQMASTTYNMAQQVGDQNGMNLLQGQIQMHQQISSELEAASQNPQAFTDPQTWGSLYSRIQEYDYRCKTGDQRPTDQIQPELTQFIAQANWQANTPEGQAAFQASLDRQTQDQAAYSANMTAGHNARMNGIQASADAHNARMNALHSQADAHNAAWARDQGVSYESQAQRVHGIKDEYEYSNPNTGDRYWVPLENQNPSVVNSDGSQTELQPYYPSSNY